MASVALFYAAKSGRVVWRARFSVASQIFSITSLSNCVQGQNAINRFRMR